jgi:hypothetical protein
MQLINHEPVFKSFGNGFQITFPNRYTVLVKHGIGTRSTLPPGTEPDVTTYISSRFGGNTSPDVEVEIYNPSKTNITHMFGEIHSLAFVSVSELARILFLVSNLFEPKK